MNGSRLSSIWGLQQLSLAAGSGWEGQEEEEDARREEILSSGYGTALVQPPFQSEGLKETLSITCTLPLTSSVQQTAAQPHRKQGSPAPKRCHVDHRSGVPRSSPTLHSKARVKLPDIMNTHHFTEQHLISSSDFCASDTETSRTGI